MYQVGDLIVYGGNGVCRVLEIKPRDTRPGKGQLYYTLEPLHQNCMIFTPVDNPKVFMRPIVSREEAERLIDQIPSMQAEAYHSRAMRELTEHYEACIKTHDCLDLLALTMSIHAKKQAAQEQKRKFGAVDGGFLRRAEELLFSELAAALGIQQEEVPDYIAARVAKLQNRSLSQES